MGPQANSDNGFTTVELMAVLLVLAVLIAIAIAVYTVSVDRAGAIACIANQRTINGVIAQYSADNESAELTDLEDLEPYVTLGTGFRCATNPSIELVLLPAPQMVTCPTHP